MKDERDSPAANPDAVQPRAEVPAVQPSHQEGLHDPATTKRTRKRRTDIGALPVEVVQAKDRNSANPYSYLTPTERAQRLAELWHDMFQQLNASRGGNSASQSNSNHQSP